MKKIIEKIKRNIADESMKAGLVLLGAVSGAFIIKGTRKLTADYPSLDAFAEYVLPILTAGGGLIIAAATDTNSKVKYFGYGLMAAGSIEGVKLIPVANDFLSGTLGSAEIQSANSFYTEDGERERIMQGFGLSELPVSNAAMQAPMEMDTRLPDLEGATPSGESEDLGYNGSATDDTDSIKGII
jgi:hypothetical protein